jgi:hypothetical protein
MKRRNWKRLFVGWFLVNLLLSTPAVAQYTYYYWDSYPSYGSGGSSDDGLGIKPWMILAYTGYYALSSGGLGGCTRDRQQDLSDQ